MVRRSSDSFTWLVACAVVLTGCTETPAPEAPLKRDLDGAKKLLLKLGQSEEADSCWDYIYTMGVNVERMDESLRQVTSLDAMGYEDSSSSTARTGMMQVHDLAVQEAASRHDQAIARATNSILRDCPATARMMRETASDLAGYARITNGLNGCAGAIDRVIAYLREDAPSGSWADASAATGRCPENIWQAAKSEGIILKAKAPAPQLEQTPAPPPTATAEVVEEPIASESAVAAEAGLPAFDDACQITVGGKRQCLDVEGSKQLDSGLIRADLYSFYSPPHKSGARYSIGTWDHDCKSKTKAFYSGKLEGGKVLFAEGDESERGEMRDFEYGHLCKKAAKA